MILNKGFGDDLEFFINLTLYKFECWTTLETLRVNYVEMPIVGLLKYDTYNIWYKYELTSLRMFHKIEDKSLKN